MDQASEVVVTQTAPLALADGGSLEPGDKGVINTRQGDDMLAIYGADEMLAEIPAGHFGEPSDVANVVVFCASGRAKYSSGATIDVTGASFILVHQKPEKPANATEVLKFFDWALKNGQKMAVDLDYVPMPDAVTKLVAEAWKTQVKDASGKAPWN